MAKKKKGGHAATTRAKTKPTKLLAFETLAQAQRYSIRSPQPVRCRVAGEECVVSWDGVVYPGSQGAPVATMPAEPQYERIQRSVCPRCGSLDTYGTSTQGRVAYRKCRTIGCEHFNNAYPQRRERIKGS